MRSVSAWRCILGVSGANRAHGDHSIFRADALGKKNAGPTRSAEKSLPRGDDVLNLVIPYCGAPPAPGELLTRFNLDFVLIACLAVLTIAHLTQVKDTLRRNTALAGWLVAAAALISPLCALSVALFSARISQHMILLLIAAPLIASGLPRRENAHSARGMRCAAIAFFIALWFWHMPNPYDATFTSSTFYWLMHVSLFGSGLWLWRELLHHAPEHTAEALLTGMLSSMQMGLLGAVLTLAGHPMFEPHFLTASLWHLTPLQDQQLGGVVMWVPGILLFLWVAIRSLRRLWAHLEEESRPA
jgi:putative membrane protein